jgi:hypothetical protein
LRFHEITNAGLRDSGTSLCPWGDPPSAIDLLEWNPQLPESYMSHWPYPMKSSMPRLGAYPLDRSCRQVLHPTKMGHEEHAEPKMEGKEIRWYSCPERCLDISAGQDFNGNHVQTWHCSGGELDQRFARPLVGARRHSGAEFRYEEFSPASRFSGPESSSQLSGPPRQPRRTAQARSSG